MLKKWTMRKRITHILNEWMSNIGRTYARTKNKKEGKQMQLRNYLSSFHELYCFWAKLYALISKDMFSLFTLCQPKWEGIPNGLEESNLNDRKCIITLIFQMEGVKEQETQASFGININYQQINFLKKSTYATVNKLHVCSSEVPQIERAILRSMWGSHFEFHHKNDKLHMALLQRFPHP